ncbi:STAS domain-containing protein [Motiliproteus sp.]|uniref:STAS domain-containing protein n=1 Tax=Motiliproteus sp. TaxID=1898955 RepID=UPI003BAA6AE3
MSLTPSLTAMTLMESSLVVSVSGDWDEDYLQALQQALILRLKQSDAKGLILDLGTVSSIDSLFVRTLVDTSRMASLLGIRSRISGINPGVAASIIALDLDCRGLVFERSIDDARTALSKSSAHLSSSSNGR